MNRQEVTLGLVAILVIIAGVAQLALGPGRTGDTTDEFTHVMRTQAWIDSGEYVPELLVELGGPTASRFVYGPAFSAVAHLGNVVTGVEDWGQPTVSEGATNNRHRTSALLALATALTAGIGAAFATGSRLIGLWAAAALLSIPIWTGMGMFNPKDTPAAAGFTMFTVSLVLALRSRPPGQRADPWDLGILALAGGGLFLCVGTRIALWMPLAPSFLLFLGLAWQARRSEGRRLRPGSVLAGVLLGLAGLLALYPAAFTHPFDLLVASVSDSSRYGWTGVTLTAGQLLPENPPWWYLPAWAFASVPVLIGALALVGLAGTVRSATGFLGPGPASRGPPPNRPSRIRTGAGLLLLVQLLVVPLGSLAVGATMYSGLRQHLYIVPAIAMLAAIGVSMLADLNRDRGGEPGTARGWLLTALLSLALLVPMVEQVRLFPFNYVYINPLAGIGGVDSRWEGDYWWASLKEASGRVPDGQVAYCATVDPLRRFDPDSIAPCPDVLRPYAPQGIGRGPPDPAGTRWTLIRRRGGAGLPPECRPAGSVTRQLRTETLVISYVARC